MTSGFCFGQSRRLLKASDFSTVFNQAEFKVSRSRLLCLSRKNHLDHPRIGLVIAKKNVRLAVQRNRLKRIIRESFRLHQAELKNLDIVILARKGADQLDKQVLHNELGQIWQKLEQKTG